jgi:hypothetical protein
MEVARAAGVLNRALLMLEPRGLPDGTALRFVCLFGLCGECRAFRHRDDHARGCRATDSQNNRHRQSQKRAHFSISAVPSDSVAPEAMLGKSLLRMRCFAERLRKEREVADFTTQYQARLTPLRNRYRNPHRLAARQRTSAANLLPKMDRLPISSFTVGIVVPI